MSDRLDRYDIEQICYKAIEEELKGNLDIDVEIGIEKKPYSHFGIERHEIKVKVKLLYGGKVIKEKESWANIR